MRSEVKDFRSGAAGKPSVNSASVTRIRRGTLERDTSPLEPTKVEGKPSTECSLKTE